MLVDTREAFLKELKEEIEKLKDKLAKYEKISD
jgi:predicted translin family RNA/ssDNA-binding protein